MGYQALLFCPDERAAQLVTQVLSELDFAVEPSNEPFDAVKRLTTQHFDAIVVDCENEQNAALLFKSARNSDRNRTSLAVAVVEGQGGIAKAFRIGANLVLTKPINVEQSKGTLRVARGLLKKPDTSKPAAFEPPGAAKPTGLGSAVRPLTPIPPASRPLTPPPPPIPSTVLEVEEPVPPQPEPTDAALLESMATPEPPQPATPSAVGKRAPWPPAKDSRPFATSGGATAAAPAVEQKPPVSAPKERPVSRPKPAASPRTAEVQPPPPSFGMPPQATESGSKKWIILIVLLLVAAAAGYYGWTKFRPQPPSAPAQTAPAPAAVPAPKPSPTTVPAPESPPPEGTATEPPGQPADEEEVAPDTTTKPAPTAKPQSSAPTAKPAPDPIVVKTPMKSQAAVAPPVVGIEPAAETKDISAIMAAGEPAAKPVLRTLKISQGVSQGLLTKKVQPEYPAQARQLRIEGVVQLLATIGKDGNITDLKVLGGHPILARAASDAVKKWKYQPYKLNGQPIEFETQITVNFKLP